MRIKFLTLIFSFLTVALCAQFQHVTNRLNSPLGVYVDAAANSWVTETGTGNNDGRVLLVRPNGRKEVIVEGLPSLLYAPGGDPMGAWHTFPLPNHRIAVVIGGSSSPVYGRILVFSMRKFKPGIDAPYIMSEAIESIDVSTFALAQAGVTFSNPYSVAIDKAENWYVADAGANMVIKITKKGKYSVFAQFPPIKNTLSSGPPTVEAVPTKIVAGNNGRFYVSLFTGFPYPDGLAKIYELDSWGKKYTHASGLSRIIDMHYDKGTGEIHALQYGTFGPDPNLGFEPLTAKITKISADGKKFTTIAERFDPAGGLAIDKWGSIYVTVKGKGKLLKMYTPHRVANNTDRPVLGLEVEPAKATIFEAYPNPASDYLTIEWKNEAFGKVTNLRVVDVTGRVLIEQANLANFGTQRLDLQGLNAGLYFLQMYNKNGIKTKKVFVRK